MPRKPVILDTNAVVRFIVADIPEYFTRVAAILKSTDCVVPLEVVAEVVYALRDRYDHTRQRIADSLKGFIKVKDNLVPEENVVIYALNLFASSKFDFVDCLLDGYAKINGNPIFTFDGDLQKQLEHKQYQG
jgi:predicted nucleic-acid-binding protein